MYFIGGEWDRICNSNPIKELGLKSVPKTLTLTVLRYGSPINTKAAQSNGWGYCFIVLNV